MGIHIASSIASNSLWYYCGVAVNHNTKLFGYNETRFKVAEYSDPLMTL